MEATMNLPAKPSQHPTETLLRWLVPLLVFFLIIRTPTDTDMWWHLRAGQEMVQRGQILTNDVFSFTRAGAQWTNAFWLADIAMYVLYRAGGFLALSLAAATLLAVTMLVILKQSSGSIQMNVCLILVGAFGLSPFGGVRPQLLSFLLLALLDFELIRYKQSRQLRPWIFIALFILWANVHGGFIWGLLLLAAFIGGEILNRLLDAENSLSWKNIGTLSLWSLLAGLATAINPNGISLWKLPFYTVQVSLTSINEWASPDFHRLDMHPMLWLIFILLIGLGLAKKIPDWGDILKFVGFAYMAFVSQRSIGPFIVVAIPVVSRYLWLAWIERFKPGLIPAEQEIYQRKSQKLAPRLARVMNTIIILALAVAALGRAVWLSNSNLVYAEFPVQAVNWIKEHKPIGPMFNSYNWGGYLTWALPEYPVFIDGRADLYGDELMNGWWDVVNGSDKGFALLDKWQIKFVFLEPGWPVIQKLPAQGWQVLYKDEQTVIFGR
jgi:hypothetical protein